MKLTEKLLQQLLRAYLAKQVQRPVKRCRRASREDRGGKLKLKTKVKTES
jgi:hypothetical protein